MDSALESIHNVEPGDCIVCFNKQVSALTILTFKYWTLRCPVFKVWDQTGHVKAKMTSFRTSTHSKPRLFVCFPNGLDILDAILFGPFKNQTTPKLKHLLSVYFKSGISKTWAGGICWSQPVWPIYNPVKHSGDPNTRFIQWPNSKSVLECRVAQYLNFVWIPN